MLNDAVGFSAVYIMTGYTDLRSGIDRLAALVESKTDVNPCQPNTLYLFCGGSFQWPRNEAEVMSLTDQQFRWLMEGLTIHPRRRVMEITPSPDLS